MNSRPTSAGKVRWLALMIFLLILNGCDDPIRPGAELVEGSYSATMFTTTEDEVETDLLAIGGMFTLDLNEHGNFTGRIIVPNREGVLSDLDIGLRGDWRYDDPRPGLVLTGYPETFINGISMPVREDPTRPGESSLQLTTELSGSTVRIFFQEN